MHIVLILPDDILRKPWITRFAQNLAIYAQLNTTLSDLDAVAVAVDLEAAAEEPLRGRTHNQLQQYFCLDLIILPVRRSIPE